MKILSESDPKSTWNFIRRIPFTQTKGSNPLHDIEVANQHFAELVHEEAACARTYLNSSTQLISSDDKFQISPLDVISTSNLLKRIKPNTATGPDNIPAFLIRKLAQFISPNIAQL